jgi:hypothetical protein
MLEGLLILFFAWFLPLIVSVLFLLFRLSSRFGYSIITLKVPLVVVAVAGVYTISVFVYTLDTLGLYPLAWLSGLFVILIIASWVVDSRYLRKLTKKRISIVKKINTPRQVVKIIARLSFVAIITPLTLIILGIVWLMVTNPIFDNLDQNKFISLDSRMKEVYQNLKTTSNGVDDWKYKTVCSPNRSGWMENGTYNCIVSISTKTTTTSVDEINSLQARYYPILEKSQNLQQKSELDLEMPSDFGKNFVVSSAEKNYTEIKSGVECRYLLEVNQSGKNRDRNFDSYGSSIINSVGNVVISIRCDETARSFWYGLVQETSMLIPE